MYDDDIANEHEHAHQKGLTRGFDLGWSYKGRFDRQLLEDLITKYDKKYPRDAYAIDVLQVAIKHLKEHNNNREFIT